MVERRCGSCKLWEPFYPRRRSLGGKCMWKSTEVWPASTVDVPGVRGPVALFMGPESGRDCKVWTRKPKARGRATDMTRDDFEFVSVGNWFSEYRCRHCGKVVVVSDDSDVATKPEQWHECTVLPTEGVR